MEDNKNNVNVPNSIHSGCSLAETGSHDYDDFDNPLAPLDIIPEEADIQFVENCRQMFDGFDGPYLEVRRVLPSGIKSPSDVRKEILVSVTIPSGEHPIDFLKRHVEITNAWVFLDSNVLEALRKLPHKFHQATVAYGEFFRFEDFDTISLQEVQYFDDWKVLKNWNFDGEEFSRVDTPDFIVQLRTR